MSGCECGSEDRSWIWGGSGSGGENRRVIWHVSGCVCGSKDMSRSGVRVRERFGMGVGVGLGVRI